MSRLELPEAKFYALTWDIPAGFGGMTSAFLQRSRAFVREGHRSVDVLTFDARPDITELERELRDRGELLERMRLLNLWDWLRDNPENRFQELDRVFTPLRVDATFRSSYRGDRELTRCRMADDGSVLQVDHFRLDGSLLLSDRRDTDSEGMVGGRSIVLCGVDGQPVRSWGNPKALYRYWLDRLTNKEPSIVFIDSKTSAKSFIDFRRSHIRTVHVVHSSHLIGNKRPLGRIRDSRREVFEKLDGFDAVVVLTERQRHDIEVLLGPQPTVFVVPNSRDVEGEVDPFRERPAGAGVMIASLTDRKRVAHAVEAVTRVQSSVAASVSLDIYGDGERRADLEQLIAESGASNFVRLQGYQPHARAALMTASFVVLSSTSEGFPLVLIEAMASGCIPIAYDIPYGPADIIGDGENGYLVPSGDRNALADAIKRLIDLPESRRAAMRSAAVRSSTSFTDKAVTDRWATVLDAVLAKRPFVRAEPIAERAVRRLRRSLALLRS